METFLPALTSEQEKELVERLKQGDPTAKEELILHNMRIVMKVVNRFHSNDDHFKQELFSEGSKALFDAAQRFDFRGKFSSYVVPSITNNILAYYRKLKNRQKRILLILDEPVKDDTNDPSEENEIYKFVDSDDKYAEIDDKDETCRRIKMLRKCLKSDEISDIERQILSLRYGLETNKPMSQREAAQIIGISRSYLCKIENKTLSKLKTMIMDYESNATTQNSHDRPAQSTETAQPDEILHSDPELTESSQSQKLTTLNQSTINTQQYKPTKPAPYKLTKSQINPSEKVR